MRISTEPRNHKFNHPNSIEDLKDIQTKLKNTIESESRAFLNKYAIIVTPECPKDYFETIMEKAYNKEPPFKNKTSDGFKDAIIWYSIIDYLKNEKIGTEDSIFFFTANKKDFDSESNLLEFKKIIKKDLHIIDYKGKPSQIFDSEHKTFLQYTLKEAQSVRITEIEVKYSEFEGEWIIEKIFAKPFPSNLVSLLSRINPESKNCKKNLKERIIKLLENFVFNVDSTKINFSFIQLPTIEKITIFLNYHHSNHFYDIDHIEVVYDDDTGEVEPKNENILISEDFFKHDETDEYSFYWMEPTIHQDVVRIVEKIIDRKLHPDSISYEVLD